MPPALPEAKDTRKDVVNATSVQYDMMSLRWKLIHALLGGTMAMRAGREDWLPREEEEGVKAYEARLGRSILYEAYGDTVEKIKATPFQEPVNVTDCPEVLEYLIDDCDGCGTSLTEFGRMLLDDMCNYGLTHGLTDFSTIPQNENPDAPASIADEKAAGARATFVQVSPPDLIGWRTMDPNAGIPVLGQVRISETKIEPKGLFLDEEVEYVRVYNHDAWALWRKGDDGDFHLQPNMAGVNSLGEVPLSTAYANKKGFMVAFPPLEKLAWLNLAHYQSDSDQRNILRIGRFGILFAKGLTKEEAKKGLTVGPFQMYASSSNEADMKYVEHAGRAIEAGRLDLQDLVDRMEVMGHQPLVKKASEGTATGKRIDAAKNLSILQAWILALESMLQKMFEYAAKWHKVELPDTFGIDIYSDFEVALMGTEDQDFLLKLAVAGFLSGETLLSEIQRRGTIADAVDVEEELGRIAAQGPALGLLGEDEESDKESDETGEEDGREDDPFADGTGEDN